MIQKPENRRNEQVVPSPCPSLIRLCYLTRKLIGKNVNGAVMIFEACILSGLLGYIEQVIKFN